MADHKSSVKRARQTIKKTAQNSQIKSSVRTFEKKVRKAIADKDKKSFETLMPQFVSKLAKAAKKNIFHKKMASRKVSRIFKQANSL